MSSARDKSITIALQKKLKIQLLRNQAVRRYTLQFFKWWHKIKLVAASYRTYLKIQKKYLMTMSILLYNKWVIQTVLLFIWTTSVTRQQKYYLRSQGWLGLLPPRCNTLLCRRHLKRKINLSLLPSSTAAQYIELALLHSWTAKKSMKQRNEIINMQVSNLWKVSVMFFMLT